MGHSFRLCRQTMELTAERALVIALNTLDLGRGIVLRLVQERHRWATARVEQTAGLALEVGVPSQVLGQAILLRQEAAHRAHAELAAARAIGARLVTLIDPDYPHELRELDLPPPVLSIRGAWPERRGIAIVGSRNASPYGKEVAGLFAEALAEQSLPIVSGFARGVDTAAHEGALRTAIGTTVAVLGCGLTYDYPRGSRPRADRIAKRGAMISELPIAFTPRSWHFPLRNRVIAALSWGVLVVEARPRSGSLITVRHALDLGREVWAIPGRIFDENALGPNSLAREGAALVVHPRQILDALPAAAQFGPTAQRLDPGAGPSNGGGTGEAPGVGFDALTLPAMARKVWRRLVPGSGQSVDQLASALGNVAVDEILTALLELELLGEVQRLPGPLFMRRARRSDLPVPPQPLGPTSGGIPDTSVSQPAAIRSR